MNVDPYRYFRVEAKEILAELGQDVLQLERGVPGPELAPRMFRLAHTLKGAARVVRQAEIAGHAHAIEEILAPLRVGGSLPRGAIDDVLRALDAIAALVAAIDLPPAAARPVAGERAPTPAASAAAPTAADVPRSVRVDVDEVDAVLRALAEAELHVRALRERTATLGRALRAASRRAARGGERATRAVAQLGTRRDPEATSAGGELEEVLAAGLGGLGQGSERLERELGQARQAAERLRLVSAGELLAPLDRTARDAARALGKQVHFTLRGGDARLDGHVLAAAGRALEQVVRNAVAHGIEAPADRRRAGKAPEGRVTLTVERRGGRVAFVCRDDGAGIDLDALRAQAARRGLLTTGPGAAAPSDDDLLRILLGGGLSTSFAVTELAGRGIGLDIVREVAAHLRGEVTLRSTRGEGASLELIVPMSRSAIEALLIEVGGATVALPLDAVVETTWIGPGDIHRGAQGDALLHAGRSIPYLPLERALPRGEPAAASARATAAVVLRAGSALAAVGVEKLAGTAELVVRGLPPLAGAAPHVAGAVIGASGIPQLVLDPVALVDLVAHADPIAPADAKERRPILVVDDSLTTRMLEKSILESAGYEVHLASSGEEGLARARERRPGLFLVDVEMPGIDGFTFIERARADPDLAATPAILVTSRNEPEDRARGAAVGAAAYVVKSEFDQGELLRTIARLMR